MKYVANPVEVDAFKIVGVIDAGCYELENGEEFRTTAEMMSRISPNVGDYKVIQSDGYIYLNPKDVFERKYRPRE
jgi:hypothetical protein